MGAHRAVLQIVVTLQDNFFPLQLLAESIREYRLSWYKFLKNNYKLNKQELRNTISLP